MTEKPLKPGKMIEVDAETLERYRKALEQERLLHAAQMRGIQGMANPLGWLGAMMAGMQYTDMTDPDKVTLSVEVQPKIPWRARAMSWAMRFLGQGER